MKKIIKSVLLLSAISMSNQVLAYCGTPPGLLPPAVSVPTPDIKTSESPTSYTTTQYWKTCWASVDGHSFSGDALRQLDKLKTDYQQTYHAALLAQVTEASSNKVNALNGSYQSLLQILGQNYTAVLEGKMQMKTQMLELELDYAKELQEDKMNEKHQGFFSDENGKNGVIRSDTQSYQYFKSVCKRNKMLAKTAGATYKEQRNAKINKSILSTTKKMTETTGNTNSIAQSVVQTHYSKFCSAEEIKYDLCTNDELKLCVDDDSGSGVCKTVENEVFEMVNKDTDAVNLINPNGFDGSVSFDGTVLTEPKNKLEDELFDVKFTYDEDQKEAASVFANNLIFQAGVQAPNSNEKDTGSSAEYIAQYNRYLANLNLAHLSFQTSIQSREPITKGEIKMSEKDVMRYIIHDLKNPDTNAATMASKTKGRELMLYQLMAVNNKLKLQNLYQKERIEVLLAAFLSQTANDPDLIRQLEALK